MNLQVSNNRKVSSHAGYMADILHKYKVIYYN